MNTPTKIIITIVLAATAVAAFLAIRNTADAPDLESEVPARTDEAEGRVKAEDYIRKNISALSPEPEVLGGTFFVTSLNFTGTQSGIVAYEDGHNAYAAAFAYAIDKDGGVSVTSFEIIPDGGLGTSEQNFSKAGNIVAADGGGWMLVYEEPGKPALRAELRFDAQSVCDVGQGPALCGGAGWNVGDRVRVEGRKQNDAVEVSKMTRL